MYKSLCAQEEGYTRTVTESLASATTSNARGTALCTLAFATTPLICRADQESEYRGFMPTQACGMPRHAAQALSRRSGPCNARQLHETTIIRSSDQHDFATINHKMHKARWRHAPPKNGTRTPSPAAKIAPPTSIATTLAAADKFCRSHGRSRHSSSDAVPMNNV